MGLFRRGNGRDERLDAVAAQLAELDRRLAEVQAERSDLQTRLNAVEHRPLPAPTPPPDTNDLAAKVRALLGDPPPAIDPRRVDQLEASNERLQLRVVELASTLTNQLGELGGEIDAIERSMARRLQELEAQVAEAAKPARAAASNGDRPPDEVLEELRANQVRIANELARFSIAVREEMAAMMPRVGQKPDR